MTVAVLGAGAFGISLAIALATDGQAVTLWCRDPHAAARMQQTRQTSVRLPGHTLPDSVTVVSSLDNVEADTLLLAIPMQELAGFLDTLPDRPATLVACCKGIDRQTGLGPVATIQTRRANANAALLTGPSFAQDIAQGLPTALVLAAKSESVAQVLQDTLTRPALRLYRTTDVIGAELGGALKNVVALSAGMAIGAGLGDSARASVIARGFAELRRFAKAKGADLETIQGLSGLGDLVLTCTSEKSRNFMAGVVMGKGEQLHPNATVEGLATAEAVATEALGLGLELPLFQTLAAVIQGKLDIEQAIATLMSRPVGKE